ncbi:RHS repeat-associated core domain-containing protein [Amycolatopsis sp. QT-25]|uniref:RHS repeat-associated core domain-containing protein n=1 Tax=Amycolatopsis sp. QT-25 TaxID=3034022 RepID=UPI0023EAD72F|nr:RHS repeat-associated core domain-containing protein [Amycolatopsis sp. QT-25]WET81197.1 RHS repeat-associated core domain-containing protein [Amycolatopsis sp. QT-25]
MRSKFSRRSMLHGTSLFAISALVVTSPAAVVQAAEAPSGPLDAGVSIPASAWVPPTQVNRVPVGAAPPALPWQGPGSRGQAAPDAMRADAVTCSPGVATGVMNQYPLERFPVSDRSELLVNTANGNVVINASDLTVKGTGQHLSLNHVYNSKLADGGALGTGWSLNTGRDVGLTFEGDNVVLHGDSAYCATFTKNASGGYKPAPGVGAEFAKLDGGTYTLTFNGSNEKWSFNAQGWLLSQADRNGNSTTPRYHGDGTLASITDSQGRVTTFAYDGAQHLTAITDHTGTTAASYVYDSTGKLTSYADRAGNQTTLQYDAANNLSALTDPNKGKTQLFYDSSDRVTEVRVPGQAGPLTTLFAYGDKQTTETDANTNKVTYKFDDQGRQTEAVDALGHSQKRTWTANSDVQVTTDGLTNNTTRSYDSLNNLIGTELPTGAKNAIGYTKSGQPHLPTSVKDPQNNEVTRDYDSAGNLTKVRSTGLNADLQVFTYNHPQGTVASSADGNGQLTTFGYDAAGNLTSMDPSGPIQPTRYGYDSLSRVTSVTDGNGVRLDFSYDKLDRVVAVSRNGQASQANTYDAIGNLITRRFGAVTTAFQWAKTPAASQPIQVKRSEGASVETVGYTYDKVGNLNTLTDTGGTTTYTYDAADRLTTLADPFGQSTTFGYDDADRRTRANLAGGTVQYTGYDKSGRQTSITVNKTGGIPLLRHTYNYTKSGGGDSEKLQTKNINGDTTAYTYDSLGRLIKAGNDTFAHDTASNMTNLAGTAFTINTANQSTTAGNDKLAFDGAGNLTGNTAGNTSHTYSPTNQLTRTTTGGQQVLSADYDTIDQTQRRTITETVNGSSTTHIFGETALGTTQVIDNGARTSYTRDPDGTPITQKTATGALHNLITDYQGSVLGLIDSNGQLAATYTYSPYGTATATGPAADTNHFRWIGTYQLRNGTNLTGYRNYNPTWGRFTQPDPTGQEPNPYNYATGDPINNSDPTGAYSWADFAGDAVGGLFGTAVGAVVGVTISSFFSPVVGGIVGVGVGGCVKESVSNVVTNNINGQSTSLGESAGACAGGAVLGAL